jgi:hypothetical protein
MLGCSFTGIGQKIKIVNAAAQEWSGGVAGRMGTNYYFELQTSDYKITPDTVWVMRIPYPVNFSDSLTPGIQDKRIVDKVHHKVTYIISMSEQRDEDPVWKGSDMLKKPEKTPTKQYKGAALVTYEYKKKQCSVLIKQFKYLEPINYP